MRLVLPVLGVFAAVGCYDQLKAGRCERDADCAGGLVCSQEMTAGLYHRCVQRDGGLGGDAQNADGGDVSEVRIPECLQDRQCSPERPICGPGGSCGPCDSTTGAACAGLYTARPVCSNAGSCVECVESSDCATSAKPVCDLVSNTCVPCMRDADCAGRAGPGVCMSHQDGRCASDGETIYVEQTTSCTTSSDATAGTPDMPFCGLDKAAVALTTVRRLFVVRGTVQGTSWTLQASAGASQVSIIGQQTAVIAGGAFPGLRIVTADAFVRDLIVRRSEQIGISAASGSTLRLQNVSVENNGGGGVVVDSSAFDIRNTSISGNGPGSLGAITWGGLLVQSPPTQGPARLERVTISGNTGPGISCTVAIEAVGVLATANSPIDIGPTCGITSCGAPSSTCGAM